LNRLKKLITLFKTSQTTERAEGVGTNLVTKMLLMLGGCLHRVRSYCSQGVKFDECFIEKHPSTNRPGSIPDDHEALICSYYEPAQTLLT
jgi:hypothetical protein